MIRLPIKARRSPNPNKDIIAYALFGKTYGEIAGTADRETRKYIAGINKQDSGPERDALGRFSGTLGRDTKMHEIYGGEEIKSSERWYEVIDKVKIRRLKDANTPVREKLNTINGMVAEKERELGIDKLRGPTRDARILELSQKPKYNDKLAALNAALRLRTLYNNTYQVRSVETRESIGDAVKLQKIFNHYNTLRDFSDAYEIPSDPDSARGIRVWFEGGNINGKTYEPRDPEISKYLWYSQETVGVQNMVINGFTAKKLENRGFRKKVEYGPDITRTVNDNASLANYVETQDAGGMSMAELYARQIYTILGARVNPQHLISALRNDAVKVNQLNGFNTGVNDKKIIDGVNFHAAAWSFPLEVTLPNGQKGYINLGIKPNCSNLVFNQEIFSDLPIITANSSSWQNLRVAMTLRMFMQKSKEGPKKKNPPKEKEPPRKDTPPHRDTPPDQPQPPDVPPDVPPETPKNPYGNSTPENNITPTPTTPVPNEIPVESGPTIIKELPLPAPSGTSAS